MVTTRGTSMGLPQSASVQVIGDDTYFQIWTIENKTNTFTSIMFYFIAVCFVR